MPAYTNISNALVSVGAKPFATTIQALRDNPIAIAEGDALAPRIQDAALDTGAASGAGRDWVLRRTALAAYGALGTYALLYDTSNSAPGTVVRNPGETLAGSSLRPSSATAGIGTTGPSGTWQCMGRSVHGTTAPANGDRVTLWLRIS